MSWLLDYLTKWIKVAAAYVAGIFTGRTQKDEEQARNETQAWEDREKVADRVKHMDDDSKRKRLQSYARSGVRGVEENNTGRE